MVKANYLSREQTLRFSVLLCALFFMRLGFENYSFVNYAMRNCFIFCWSLIPALLVLVIKLGSRGFVRVSLLVVMVPFALCTFICGLYMILSPSVLTDYERVQKASQIGETTVELISYKDLLYEDVSDEGVRLEISRVLWNGILRETQNLVDVLPAAHGSGYEIADHGKKIRFTSPAIERRKEISILFDTDLSYARTQSNVSIRFRPGETDCKKTIGIFPWMWF